MMVVVADAVSRLDEITNHRAGPNTRRVPRRHRTALDDLRQRRALILRQPGRRSLGRRRPQTLDVVGVIPLQPAIHGAPGDPARRSDVDDASAIDVRANGVTSTPLGEVIPPTRMAHELVEQFELCRAAARASNGVPCLGLRHDPNTLILSRSAVKCVDPWLRDPV